MVALLPALNDALWAVAGVSTPRSLRSLSWVSIGVHQTLSPVAEQNARLTGLLRRLAKLPLRFSFPPQSLSLEQLEAALSLDLRWLRWREKAGMLAGWVPTEEEVWRLSKSQLAAVVAAARLAGPGLLFGATLRWEEGEGEPEATKPLAFEWAEGPAADPLQLALKLRLKEEMCLQLEVTSGGWSDWSETWSLEDGSLEASLCLAMALPGEGHVVLRQSKQRGSCEAVPGGRGRSHAETAELLRRHLTAGDGVLAVLGVSSLRYHNSDGSAPCWRPRELRRLEGRG